MTHRFPIKEIARQAGMSTATVDRVLNNRSHVSPQTRLRVLAAVAELDQQEGQLSAKGRQLFVDVVVEAPARFSREIRRATHSVLPSLAMAVFRPRFITQEVMQDQEAADILARIGRGRSQGVCLKARDVPAVREQVTALRKKGIPVVTLVTDIQCPDRVAYAGLDNANAGQTAAYLLSKMLPRRPGCVLATRSQNSFSGEAERFLHFSNSLADLRPDVNIVDLSGSGGLSQPATQQIAAVLPGLADLLGLYSMGGGNAATLKELDHHGWRDLPYVAHDLDVENRLLLRDGKISFVLHHDLTQDLSNALRAVAAFHGLNPEHPEHMRSNVQIITPANLPF